MASLVIDTSRLPSRFWRHVVKADNGCWIWTGHRSKNGYAEFWLSKERPWVRVHRYIWELLVGPIPSGLRVIHECRNHSCVNPSHLFLGSHKESLDDKPFLEERFWSHVEKSGNDCWEWKASKTNGYGAFGVGRKIDKAHRVSWRLANGAIPKGLFVCHRCDNRACVNPDHLFLGTAEDNVRDMIQKGRMVPSKQRREWMLGERHHSAVLDNQKALAIKHLLGEGLSGTEVATRVGVKPYLVYSIKYGLTWTHL